MDSKRKFLEKVVASGLATGAVTTDDVLEHASPSVLAESLPVDLKAKLIAASLEADAVTTAFLVETVGTEDLAKHLPTAVLWTCVAMCAERALAAGAGSKDVGGSAAAAAARPQPAAVKSAAPSAVPDIAPSKAPSKPNATARPKAASKSGGSSSSKSKAIPRSKAIPQPPRSGSAKRAATGPGRAQTSPVASKSDFDVDTDIGEDDWGVNDIVEVVEEAEIVGAQPLDETKLNEGLSDWKSDEETVTRDADS